MNEEIRGCYHTGRGQAYLHHRLAIYIYVSGGEEHAEHRILSCMLAWVPIDRCRCRADREISNSVHPCARGVICKRFVSRGGIVACVQESGWMTPSGREHTEMLAAIGGKSPRQVPAVSNQGLGKQIGWGFLRLRTP